MTEREADRRRLEAAWRALDYSQVPGNKPPTADDLRLIRADVASRTPRDEADADLIRRQLAWLDAKLAG